MGIISYFRNFGKFRKISKRISVSDWDAFMERIPDGSKESVSFGIVGKDEAMSLSAVYSAILQIAQTVASLPLNVYEKVTDRERRPYDVLPLYKVLKYQANPQTNSFMWVETMMHHCLLLGNHFSYINRDRGNRVVGLTQLNPNAVKICADFNGRLYYKYRNHLNQEIELQREEVLHIAGLGFDGFQGYSPLTLMAEAIGLGLSYEQFTARFLSRGTHLGGVLSFPNKLEAEQREQVKKMLEEKYAGLDKTANIMVTHSGAEFKPVGMALKDAQFLENRVFQISEVARWLNIPVHKLKEMGKTSYNNIAEEQLSYLTDTIRPWLVRIESQLLSQLLRADQWSKIDIEFDATKLLRADIATQSEALQKQRMSGIINADEWRFELGMNPIGGKAGSAYWTPVNVVAVDKSGKSISPPPEEPKQIEEVTPNEEQTDE